MVRSGSFVMLALPQYSVPRSVSTQQQRDLLLLEEWQHPCLNAQSPLDHPQGTLKRGEIYCAA